MAKKSFVPVAAIALALLLPDIAAQGFIFPDSDDEATNSNADTGTKQAEAPSNEDDDTCKPIADCPPLMEILESNPNGLTEFDSCGFDDEYPTCLCGIGRAKGKCAHDESWDGDF